MWCAPRQRPWTFIILNIQYINDIHISVPNRDLKLFADDTKMFMFGSNLQLLESEANICLRNLEMWFSANKLTLNIDKTCYMVFGCQSDVTLNLFINGQRINKVSSCKYLGVIIDDALKWNEHIDYIYKKIIRFCSIIYKLRMIVPRKVLNNLLCIHLSLC